ncbi:MAG: SH3 domain-containing protein, partial [Aggregatilineales bacterium]
MSDNPFLVKIRGLIEYPNIVEVNIRNDPSTKNAIAFKAAVGLDGLRVLDVKPDGVGNNKDGKVYQWFQVDFNDGRIGWIRDDLIEIRGDGGQFGYGSFAVNTYAFDLTRGQATVAPSSAQPTVATPATATTSPETSAESPAPASTTPQPAPVLEGIERVKKASFAITAAFEGTGYAAYNNYDAGIISYGLIQFTMAAGS